MTQANSWLAPIEGHTTCKILIGCTMACTAGPVCRCLSVGVPCMTGRGACWSLISRLVTMWNSDRVTVPQSLTCLRMQFGGGSSDGYLCWPVVLLLAFPPQTFWPSSWLTWPGDTRRGWGGAVKYGALAVEKHTTSQAGRGTGDFTCGGSGSCRWRGPTHHSLGWDMTCPPSSPTSRRTGSHWRSHPSAA